MNKRFSSVFAVMGLALIADQAMAAQPVAPAPGQLVLPALNEGQGTARPEPIKLTKADGMFMLDYQVIPVPGNKSIDLLGFHAFTKLNDWMYLGIGAHAPMIKGEYGGFMTVGVTAHAQRKLFGNVFGNAGLSMGGGGGGKSVQHSIELSGTGGYVKSYVGLGYEFESFSVGANVARMKFKDSAINNSQFNLFIQAPFTYVIGPYSRSGETLFSSARPGATDVFSAPSESILTMGLDNFVQIKPEGANKGNINLVDLQFSHFMSSDSFWFVNAALGYRGRPLYNQALGGIGYRARLSPQVNLYGQLGIGSGGYAPETINTGPGLLLYPKVSAEYMINKNFGLALSTGYLLAPKGSSKNYTFGAALNYHLHTGGSGKGGGSESALLRGNRLHLFQQTETKVVSRGAPQPNINMVSIQLDNIVNENIYLPIQVSAAYTAYLTYPGYGEILAGVGVQNTHRKGDRFQFFGHLMAGTNVHGAIFKTGVGLNLGLSDQWAMYGVAGQTMAGLGSSRDKFRSDYFGLGLSMRFSVPTR